MFVWQQWHDEHLQRIEKTLLLSTPSGFKSVSRLEEAMAYAVGACLLYTSPSPRD